MKRWIAYVVMLPVTFGAYLLIRSYGEATVGHAAVEAVGNTQEGHGGALASVLLALAVVVVLARLMGALFERFLRQPAVMGEIVAGLMLGPSVLGAISAKAAAFVLPQAAAPHIGIVAKIGVVLFMFLVGLELDPKLLRKNTHATLAVSHASIVLPFLLGSMLALGLYPRYAPPGASFTVFSLFTGVAMSVTAFPVLARILKDRGLQTTSLGVMALACAAVDDATAWCLLALVSGVARAEIGRAGITLLWVLGFVVFLLLLVRPLLCSLSSREERRERVVSPTVLAAVFGLMLLSAVITESIGIHALFGAFLFGAMLPPHGRLAQQLRARMEDLVRVLLLPVFFAFTGMRMQVTLLSSRTDWLICAAIILVATLGKFGGSFVAARAVGMSSRDATTIGVLMNTRGLMELIVLNVGLDMGVLSPTLFAMFVLMALVTTFSTSVVLGFLDGAVAARGAPATAR